MDNGYIRGRQLIGVGVSRESPSLVELGDVTDIFWPRTRVFYPAAKAGADFDRLYCRMLSLGHDNVVGTII